MERCCCPHTVDSDDSSQSSSPYQGIDKHTQVSPTQDLAAISTELPASFYAANRDNEMPPYPELSSVGTTLLPAQTTEKSSQTYFNRNNENINSHQNKLYPSNTSQTSQLDSTVYADTINYTPMAATTSPDMEIPKLIQHTSNIATSSSLQKSSNVHKCTCQNSVTPSSSESAISANIYIQLKLNLKPMQVKPPQKKKTDPQKNLTLEQQKIILVPKILPRPERLQPYLTDTSQQFLTPNSQQITDEYHSCTSELSECDENQITFENQGNLKENFKETDKNCVILQLLHELVHLVKEDNPTGEAFISTVQEKPSSRSNITTQTREMICVPFNQSETSITQSPAKPISEIAIEEQDSPRDFENPTERGTTLEPQQPPPQLTWPFWTPCCCYLHGMAAAEGRARATPFPIYNANAGFPNNFVQEQSVPNHFPIDSTTPINQTIDFPGIREIPQDLIYQEAEVYYDECCEDKKQFTLIKSETDEHIKSETQYYKESAKEEKNLDDVKCICPKKTDVCPKHGPLETIFKQRKLSCVEGEICELNAAKTEHKTICTSPDIECPIHGGVIKSDKNSFEGDKDDMFYSRSVKNKIADPNKINIPNLDDANLIDGEEIKPILLSMENKNEKSPSRYLNENFNDPNDVSNPDLDKNKYLVKTVEGKILRKHPSEVIEDQTNLISVPNESPQLISTVEEIEKSPYIARPSATTGRNIYNFLPALDRAEIQDDEYFAEVGRYDHEEVDSADDYFYPDLECEEFDEECELAKERNAERLKTKKRDRNDDVNKGSPKQNEKISMALATLQKLEGEGSTEEMKFFIDSLILDLDAMEHARRKTAREKNLFMPRPGMCARKSFPVTITDVTDLGTTSLYVKWIIHDCSGIRGYEIYTDGYLTNRYFHCRHEAAVITNVDVTLPHKIALVAQTSTDDCSIELMCSQGKNKQKCKCLPWKTDIGNKNNSSPAVISALWTPSIYLYDPATCRSTAAPPIMRGSI